MFYLPLAEPVHVADAIALFWPQLCRSVGRVDVMVLGLLILTRVLQMRLQFELRIKVVLPDVLDVKSTSELSSVCMFPAAYLPFQSPFA